MHQVKCRWPQFRYASKYNLVTLVITKLRYWLFYHFFSFTMKPIIVFGSAFISLWIYPPRRRTQDPVIWSSIKIIINKKRTIKHKYTSLIIIYTIKFNNLRWAICLTETIITVKIYSLLARIFARGGILFL